jgi:hypothetical protein
LVRLSYWSIGITILSPSLPPFSWTITNTWSVSVGACVRAETRGDSAKALKVNPLISAGNTIPAGAVCLIKSLLFMIADIQEGS